MCSGRLGPNIPILPAANTVSYKGPNWDTSHLYLGIQQRAKKSGVKFSPFLVHCNTTLNLLKFPPEESVNAFFSGKFEKIPENHSFFSRVTYVSFSNVSLFLNFDLFTLKRHRMTQPEANILYCN